MQYKDMLSVGQFPLSLSCCNKFPILGLNLWHFKVLPGITNNALKAFPVCAIVAGIGWLFFAAGVFCCVFKPFGLRSQVVHCCLLMQTSAALPFIRPASTHVDAVWKSAQYQCTNISYVVPYVACGRKKNLIEKSKEQAHIFVFFPHYTNVFPAFNELCE